MNEFESGINDENVTKQEFGQHLGSKCNTTCSDMLQNVYCNLSNRQCECKTDYPVHLLSNTGCAAPANLGDQCFYSESCSYTDPYSTCIQINHNAICRCMNGYHMVNSQKSMRKEFCAQDLIQITTDLNTLLLAVAGLVVFSTLICFVLKLFVGFRTRTYRNATITTRLLSTSEIAQVARSLETNGSTRTYSRRGSQGVTVSSSRAAAARAAAILFVSCHVPPTKPQERLRQSSSFIDSSNVASRTCVRNNSDAAMTYSAKQFRREWNMKEAAKIRGIQKSASMDQFCTAPVCTPSSSDCGKTASLESLKPAIEAENSRCPPSTVVTVHVSSPTNS